MNEIKKTKRLTVRNFLRYARQTCPRGTRFWGNKHLLPSWWAWDDAMKAFHNREMAG
jgi:hypothetical protein